MIKDGTGARMGLRCKRFAALIDDGKITKVLVDEKGLNESSAENVLSLL
jgi:peroxiredoxin